MNEKNAGKNVEISYAKILIKIIPLVFGIVIVLYLALYYSFERSASTELSESAIDSLQYACNNMEIVNDVVVDSGFSMLYDDGILTLLHGNPDYQDIIAGKIKLRQMNFISPYIDSIYIWNEQTQKVYSLENTTFVSDKENFFDSKIFEIIENTDKKNLQIIPRKIFGVAIDDIGEAVYSYFFYDNVSDSVMILNVKISTISDLFYEPDCETFIVRQDGILLNDCRAGIAFSDVSDLPFVEKVLSLQETEGYFIDRTDEKRLIVYLKPSDQEEIFIRFFSYDQVNSNIIKMRNASLAITFLVLLAGVLLASRISRGIHQPIDKMSTIMKTLQEEKRQNEHKHRQWDLQLLFDGTEMNQGQLPGRLEQYGIYLNDTGYFILALFIIDDYSLFCQNNSTADRELFCFAISNIANEIVASEFKNEAIEMAESQVVLLINVNEPPGEQETKHIYRLCQEVQGKVKEYLGISLSCILGHNSLFCELPMLYAVVKDTEQYRMYLGKECIFYTSDITPKSPSDYIYPTETENELIKELNMGNVAGAKQRYLDIVNGLLFYPVNVLAANLLGLIVAINKVTPSFSNKNSAKMYHYNDFASQIVQCEVIDDINQLFFDFFEIIAENQKIWRDSKHNQLLDKINRIIKEESSDGNLSLEMIAERLSLTPDYVGKLFKKYTGKSIVNCINEERLENAKKLLIETKMPVSEISSQVGFVTNGYFLALFKKMNGLTPSEFRKTHRSE